MADDSQAVTPVAGWKTSQVYALAAVCLVLGLAFGYLFRDSKSAPAATPVTAVSSQATAQSAAMGGAQSMPTLEQMKQMADKKAEPLLAQLKSDPSNTGLLIQVAKIYESTHQFQEAASYYQKSLDINPKDVATRTELATCLYYQGDVDGAINQLQTSLKHVPGDTNSLFNLGVIKWQGKKDVPGAVAAWRQLLKSNPKLEATRKEQVQRLIAQASQPAGSN